MKNNNKSDTIPANVFDALFKNNFHNIERNQIKPLFPIECTYKSINKGLLDNLKLDELFDVKVIVYKDGSQRQWVNDKEVFAA